jgi:hypothetical protein
MRETVAAVVVAALLGVACEARTSTSAPAAAQGTSPAVPPATGPAPAATPAGNPRPERKAHKVTRVAKARSANKATSGTEKSARETGAVDPGAPALTLSQSRPSSY